MPGCANRDDSRPTRPPNIVLVLVDDLGWADLAVAGNELHETPHIDALAREGVFFTQAYSNAPNCSPSRASILTGQYPARHGVVTVGRPKKRRFRDSRTVDPVANVTRFAEGTGSLPAVFRDAGYATACIGKWHLRPAGDPEQMGCDLLVERLAIGYESDAHTRQVESPRGTETEYLVDRLTDEALRFIDEHREEPFFLYLSHYSVHAPLEARPETIARYDAKLGQLTPGDATYAAMVEEIDDSLGLILGRLDRLGLAENTIVVFTSDNGAVRGAPSPFRGGKGTLHEGGIRVPLIFRWPGHAEGGSVSDVPVIGMDIFPTLLDIAGLPRTEEHLLDGASLVPLLAGNARLGREALFWHVPAYTQTSPPVGAIRRGGWKLIEHLDDGTLELFHLAQDPEEEADLIESHPSKAAAMRSALQQWRERIGARLPAPRSDTPRAAAE